MTYCTSKGSSVFVSWHYDCRFFELSRFVSWRIGEDIVLSPVEKVLGSSFTYTNDGNNYMFTRRGLEKLDGQLTVYSGSVGETLGRQSRRGDRGGTYLPLEKVEVKRVREEKRTLQLGRQRRIVLINLGSYPVVRVFRGRERSVNERKKCKDFKNQLYWVCLCTTK